MCASLYACKGFSFSSSFMAVSLSALLCNERLVYWTKMWKKGPFPLCKPPVCNFSFLWCVCVYFLSEKYTRTFWCETWIQKKRTLYQVFYTAPRLCTFLFLCILFKRSTSSKIFDLEGIVGAEERKKLLKKGEEGEKSSRAYFEILPRSFYFAVMAESLCGQQTRVEI